MEKLILFDLVKSFCRFILDQSQAFVSDKG